MNGKVSHVFNVGEENDYRKECQTIDIGEKGKCSVWRKFAFLFLYFFLVFSVYCGDFMMCSEQKPAKVPTNTPTTPVAKCVHRAFVSTFCVWLLSHSYPHYGIRGAGLSGSFDK